MSLERYARHLLIAQFAISALLALPALVAPVPAGVFLSGEEPTFPFLLRLAAGFLLLIGLLSWEASRGLPGSVPLLKYLWMAKGAAFAILAAGHLQGEVLPRGMLLNLLGNLVWIPALVHLDVALRRRIRSGSSGRVPSHADREPAAPEPEGDGGRLT